MTREPFIAHSELTNEIYIVVGKEKYRVTEQAIKAVMAIKALKEKDILDKIRAEIKEWYWQADKQALAKDPCVVDAMVDLFIRTINKYKAESNG